MPWSLAGNRLDRVECRRNVIGGELALQSQGRCRNDDPFAGIPDEPEQRRSQIAERFARSGTRLDQEMMVGFQAVRDSVRHLNLTGSFGAADRPDRSLEHITVPHRETGSLCCSGHRRTLITSAAASQHPSVQLHRVTGHQLIRGKFSSKSRTHASGDQRAVGTVFSGQELAGLMDPVDQITSLVRHQGPNLDLGPRQQRLDSGAQLLKSLPGPRRDERRHRDSWREAPGAFRLRHGPPC